MKKEQGFASPYITEAQNILINQCINVYIIRNATQCNSMLTFKLEKLLFSGIHQKIYFHRTISKNR